jgi:Ribosomal RNA adenine dimethylase
VSTKPKQDYGILSVVFQIYADVKCHFKIPPTVFYPQPKVDSALVGLHFLGPSRLKDRLAGVHPRDLRHVVTTAFRQRRKTMNNSLKKLSVSPSLVLGEVDGSDGVGVGSTSPAVPASDRLVGDDAGAVVSPPVVPPLPQRVLDAQRRGDPFALSQGLPEDWRSKRPEELTPGQFIEITRLLYGAREGGGGGDGGDNDDDDDNEELLGRKVWRKLKHGVE